MYCNQKAKQSDLEMLASLVHDERFQVLQRVVGEKLGTTMAKALQAAGENFPCMEEQNLRLIRFHAAAWVIDIPEAAAQILEQKGE